MRTRGIAPLAGRYMRPERSATFNRHVRRELSTEFTPEDALLAKEEGPPPVPLKDFRQQKLLRQAIEQLPERDRETMLLTLDGKNQTEIAQILGVSQPAVWTRLRRAHKRLLWLATVGVSFSAEDLRVALQGRMLPKHVEALAVMWETTSVADTTARCCVSDRWMRRRLKTAIARLNQLAVGDAALKRFADGFRSLRSVGGRPMRFRGVVRRQALEAS